MPQEPFCSGKKMQTTAIAMTANTGRATASPICKGSMLLWFVQVFSLGNMSSIRNA